MNIGVNIVSVCINLFVYIMSRYNSDIFRDSLKIVCPCDKPFVKYQILNLNFKMGQVKIPVDTNDTESTQEFGQSCYEF